MKKLMFAIAAVAAGTVLADVTSANIVGYANTAINDDGSSGGGPMFINVGAAGEDIGLRVTDFIPSGYLNHTEFYQAGTEGGFTMMIIDNNGRGVHTYSWTHEWDWEKDQWAEAGYWNDLENSSPVEKGGAYDLAIPAGTGLFIVAPAYDDGDIEAGSTFTFASAGEVYQMDVPVEVNEDGFSCIANPFPTPVKVSSLTPSGYLNHTEFYQAGTEGAFTMMIIDNNGRGVHTYSWTHEWDWEKDQWAEAGYWNDLENSSPVEKDGAYDFPIPGGQGLILTSPAYDDGDIEARAKFIYTFRWPIVAE